MDSTSNLQCLQWHCNNHINFSRDNLIDELIIFIKRKEYNYDMTLEKLRETLREVTNKFVKNKYAITKLANQN